MERVNDVAQLIFDEYKRLSGETLDEMKLHKLLYYAQRESFAVLGEPMFEADFEGWRLGPVCKPIRDIYNKDMNFGNADAVSRESAYVVGNVMCGYSHIESWLLSKDSHKELSWRNSRKGLGDMEAGTVILSLEDIRADAEKIRPYDHLFDMYYDEFEDAVS
jgi:uncharacterized phage-associated protein